jgi:ribosomal protein L18E
MARAQEVGSHHGERTGVVVQQRISKLALQCDAAGVELWREVAAALEKMHPNHAAKQVSV